MASGKGRSDPFARAVRVNRTPSFSTSRLRFLASNRVRIRVGVADLRVLDVVLFLRMITKTAETFEFDAIEDVVSDIAKGRIVIVRRRRPRERRRSDHGRRECHARRHQFHGQAWARLDLRANRTRSKQLGIERMVRRIARVSNRLHGVDGCRPGVTTGHQRGRSGATIQVMADPTACRKTWCNRDTFFRCAPNPAGSCSARDIPKLPWIWRAWPGCRPMV